MGARIVEANDFVDENGPFRASGVSDALFDDVRSELVLRERQHFSLDGSNNAQLVFWFAMLCHKLRHILIFVNIVILELGFAKKK